MFVFLAFYELMAAVIGFAALGLSSSGFALIAVLFYCDSNNGVTKGPGSGIAGLTILWTLIP